MDKDNVVRELRKVQDVLERVQAYLYHKDAMNANLHMSENVRGTPLYSAVEGATSDIDLLVGELLDDGQDTV